MSDHFRLSVDGVVFCNYSYSNEPENDIENPFLGSLFRDEDLILKAHLFTDYIDNEPKHEIFYLGFYWTYSAEVGIIRERLEQIGCSKDIIDQYISKFSGVPKKSVEPLIIDLDIDNSYDDYFKNKESMVSKRKSLNIRDLNLNEKNFDTYEEGVESPADNFGSHLLSVINESISFRRFIAFVMDDNDSNALVEFDPTEMINLSEFPDKAWRPVRIGEIRSKNVKDITQEYLQRAWAHYYESDFYLCYIEMFIALESSLNKLMGKIVSRNSESLSNKLNLNRMTKNLSLMDQLKFTWLFLLRKKEFPEVLFDSISKAYEIRNTIVHREAKKFSQLATYRSLKDTETMISILSQV